MGSIFEHCMFTLSINSSPPLLSCSAWCACLSHAGAIDVEELQYALGVMGIAMTAEQVQELMDSVDKDGSGG